MDPTDLTVYKSPFPKKRIGKDFDGGYIISEIPNLKYNLLISAGVSDDISFEEHLCSMHPSMKCLAFDGTIDNIQFEHKNISFIKKNIGTINDNSTTTLIDLINENENIFLKMDIEGAEFDWINCLSDDNLNKVSQIVIEFHTPFEEKHKDVFKKINKNHVLVHFHPNNCCGFRNYKNVIIPNVFECTYINRKYFFELNTTSIPSYLDMPNSPRFYDIHINYPPFVHNNNYL